MHILRSQLKFANGKGGEKVNRPLSIITSNYSTALVYIVPVIT